MGGKRIGVLSLSFVIAISFIVPQAQAYSMPASTSLFEKWGSNVGGVGPSNRLASTLCGPGPETPSGIYAGPGGGAFVENANSGELLWCAAGSSSVIAEPPQVGEYFGMAGVSTSIGLVLVLVS